MSVKPSTLSFGKFWVRIQDPVDDVWKAPCGFTSKGLTRSKSVQETVVPYCDDPDAVAEIERTPDAKSSEFTGNGVLDMDYRDLWERFYQAQESWPVRIELVTPLGNSGGKWEGNFILTNAQFGAERGKKIDLSVTMLSDGAVPWTAAEA